MTLAYLMIATHTGFRQITKAMTRFSMRHLSA